MNPISTCSTCGAPIELVDGKWLHAWDVRQAKREREIRTKPRAVKS